jgi:RimJ/RimL family protein N-acetyltransferase
VTGEQRVRLRPVESGDVATFNRANTDEAVCGTFMWWGFRSGDRLQARLDSGEVISDTHGMLAVESMQGELLGDVSWNVVDNTMPPHGRCWNLGISLLPEARGKGYAVPAHRALVEYLFAHTTYERIQASTELDNVAEQRALERSGFTREGVLRRAAFRDGAYRDMVLFSILRDEV